MFSRLLFFADNGNEMYIAAPQGYPFKYKFRCLEKKDGEKWNILNHTLYKLMLPNTESISE